MTPRNVPPREQLAQRGPGSRRSSSGKSSKARLVVARLKVRKLEEEQRLKTMEYDLEKQRLQLEMKRQLLNARVEVEQAQIELSNGSGTSGDISNRSSDLPSLSKKTLHETVRGFLALCDKDRPGPDPTLHLQLRKHLPGSGIPDRPIEVVNAPEVQSISKVQQEAVKQHDKEEVRLILPGLERIEMPKIEFLSFNGDPEVPSVC